MLVKANVKPKRHTAPVLNVTPAQPAAWWHFWEKFKQPPTVLLSRTNGMRLTLLHSAQSQHCFFCDAVWRVWINRVLRFLLPPRTAAAWLVVPLNPQGKVKLHPSLCLLVMAEQDSVFRKCKDNQGWLSNKRSHYVKRVSVSSHFACQQPIYLEMCGREKKRKQMLQMQTSNSSNHHDTSQENPGKGRTEHKTFNF